MRIRERTYLFALRIIRLCGELEERGGVSRSLSWQLIRSGTSIGANVEEAQSGQSRADFIAKLSISLKEARETLFWLRCLQDSGLCRKGALKDLIDESDRIVAILVSIIVSTQRNGVRRKGQVLPRPRPFDSSH